MYYHEINNCTPEGCYSLTLVVTPMIRHGLFAEKIHDNFHHVGFVRIYTNSSFGLFLSCDKGYYYLKVVFLPTKRKKGTYLVENPLLLLSKSILMHLANNCTKSQKFQTLTTLDVFSVSENQLKINAALLIQLKKPFITEKKSLTLGL